MDVQLGSAERAGKQRMPSRSPMPRGAGQSARQARKSAEVTGAAATAASDTGLDAAGQAAPAEESTQAIRSGHPASPWTPRPAGRLSLAGLCVAMAPG